MKDEMLMEAVIINGMRAMHKKNVEDKFYKNQKDYDKNSTCSGTIEDLIFLQKEEDYICSKEEEFLKTFSKIEIPEFISVKEYAEIVGVSIWKVYREIKKGNILAEKVANRWRIYTSPESLLEVA